MRIDKTGILWSKCVKISCFRIKYMQAQCCPKRFSIKTKKGSKAKVE